MGHPWEQRKVREISEIVGGGTPSTNNPDYWDGDIDWYTPAEITDDRFAFRSQRRITGAGLKNSSAKILPTDRTILFTSRAGIGKSAILKAPGATNQGFQSLVLNDSADPKFVYSATDFIKEKAERIAAGSTFSEISGKKLGEITLMIPSKPEQKQIGQFFESIDESITLHQRKLDLLKEKKKGLLQKMFPKPGENKPELRFSGFTDPWKQRKISELFKITRGNVLAANKTEAFKSNEDPYPVYSSQTKNNGLMGYYKDYLYENAITWTTDGANAGTVNYRSGKFYCTNVCGVLLAKEIQPCLMVAERLNSVTKDYVSYVGNPKLMNNVMADININLPWQEEERQKMSDLFAMVDDLITLHQRKLDLLKEKKKGLLQKMFPKPGQQEPELRFSEFR